MTLPAAFSSIYPPSQHTFRGAVTMRLASGGADVEELVGEFAELAEDFDENFPDDAPVAVTDVAAVVDEVVAEYRRVVTTMSPDAVGLMTSLDALFESGILYSYGDAFEASDAMEDLQDALQTIEDQGGKLRGFLYSLVGDLDELVLDQRLEIAFGTFDADSAAVADLAREAVGILVAHGLKASWSGVADEPIVVEPMIMDAPLVDADDEDDPDHEH